MKNRVFSGILKIDVFYDISKNGHHTVRDKNGSKKGSFLHLKNQLVDLKYLVENDPRSKVKALVAKNLRYYVQGIMEPAWLREG